jgi:chorismate-pyruvate lyase
MDELFVAQAHRPDHIADIDLKSMTPFHRGLMVIPGFVTQFIEAFEGESVKVVCLHQAQTPSEDADPWLDVVTGSDVVRRTVYLYGEESSRLYVVGESRMVLDRLPSTLREGIEAQQAGLGQLLQQGGAETHRELLWYGEEVLDEIPAIRQFAGTRCASRSFRLVHGGRPFMVLNERFPLDSNHRTK